MSPHRLTGVSQPWPHWAGPVQSVRRPRDVSLINRQGLLFQGASSFLYRTVLLRRLQWGHQPFWCHLDYERFIQMNERAGYSLLLALHRVTAFSRCLFFYWFDFDSFLLLFAFVSDRAWVQLQSVLPFFPCNLEVVNRVFKWEVNIQRCQV